MRKFVVRGIYTEYIYAESADEALKQFDEMMNEEELINEPFDEIVCEEIPLSVKE